MAARSITGPAGSEPHQDLRRKKGVVQFQYEEKIVVKHPVKNMPKESQSKEPKPTDGQLFEKEYREVYSQAEQLLKNALTINELGANVSDDKLIQLRKIIDGKMGLLVPMQTPPSVTATARKVKELTMVEAEDALVADLIHAILWLWQTGRIQSISDPENVHKAVSRRVRALEAALLPESLQSLPAIALRHVDHELLGRKYMNERTMQGDSVASIPRRNFWVSDDNYAWDLVKDLIPSSTWILNPHSNQPFTEADVRAMIDHPIGRQLQLENPFLAELPG